jgi:iron complex outermembrane receptor protein
VRQRVIRVIGRGIIVATLLCGAAVPASAQAVDLIGRVTDPQGAAVPGATIAVTRASGGPPSVAMTGADGAYELEGLLSGVVVVEVHRAGFRRAVRTLTLAPPTAAVDVVLELAGVDETVVVTAAGSPQPLRETSKAVTTIDAADARRRHQVLIGDIIRVVPGVQVRDTGGPGQLGSLRIRGLRTDAAAVLVDGLRVRDAASPQSDASAFVSNLQLIAADRIEVLRGSGSSLYGTNAVGGVVNIVTALGAGPLAGDAEIESGSLGRVQGRASVSGGALGGRLAFSAGGLGWNVAEGRDGDDAARSEGAQGAMRFDLDPATHVSVRYLGARDRVATNASPTTSGILASDIPDATVVDAVPGRTFLPGRNDPDARRRSSYQAVALRLERQQSARVSWQASYQRVHTTRAYANGPLGPGFQGASDTVSDFRGDIDTIDVRAAVDVRPGLAVSGGYEFEREGYFEHLDDNLPPPARLITDTRASQRSHALFGAAQVSFQERRLQIGVSGRLQTFRPTAPRFSTVGTTSPYDGLAFEGLPRAVTGDLSAAYFFSQSATKIRAHAGNAYRAPGLFERFGGGFFAEPGTDVVLFSPFGDPFLEPDRYRTVDGGVDQYLWGDRALVSATLFAIDIESLTDFDFTGGIDPTTDPFGRFSGYINGSGGFSRGVELALDMRPLRALRIQAAYTYTRAESAEDIVVDGFFKIPSVSPHTTSVIVSHDWRGRLDTAVELTRVSSSFAPLFANGRPRAYRFDGFTTLNAVAAWRLRQTPLRVYVRVENAFDAEYYLGGWRALGRTVAAGLRTDF